MTCTVELYDGSFITLVGGGPSGVLTKHQIDLGRAAPWAEWEARRRVEIVNHGPAPFVSVASDVR